MRKVIYRRIQLDDGSEKQISSSLIGFIYNVVGLKECGILPPFEFLNYRLLSGGRCNPFGNVDWPPFEINREEYANLCQELEIVDPTGIHSDTGCVFAKIRRAKEFDSIKNDLQWSQTVNDKYVDEWVNNLNRLNAVEPEKTFEEEKRSELPAKAPNLKILESTLFDLASQAIKEFFSESSQSFYAFGFDCNATYGDILLCTNTLDEFKKTAEYYIEKWNYTDERLASLKRNFGDWHYQGFNIDYSFWQRGWDNFATEIETYIFHEQTSEEDSERFVELLMESFTAVLIRLEHSGALDVIQKDPEFYIQVYDHDEDPETGDRRLATARKRLTRMDKEIDK